MNKLIGVRTRLAFLAALVGMLALVVLMSSCSVPVAGEASPSSPARVSGNSVSVPPQSPDAAWVTSTPVPSRTPMPTATLTPTQLPMNYYQYAITDGVPDMNRHALLFTEPGIANLGFVPTQPPDWKWRCPKSEHDGLKTIAYVTADTVVYGTFGDSSQYYGLAQTNPKNCRYELIWVAPHARGMLSLVEFEYDNLSGVYQEPINGVFSAGNHLVDSRTMFIGCGGKGSKPDVGERVWYSFNFISDKPNGKTKSYLLWVAPSSCPTPEVASLTSPGFTPVSKDQFATQIAGIKQTSTAMANGNNR